MQAGGDANGTIVSGNIETDSGLYLKESLNVTRAKPCLTISGSLRLLIFLK